MDTVLSGVDVIEGKVMRNGMVAVIISPGFGGGWFTWNDEHPSLLFDPILVWLIENNHDDRNHDAIVLRKEAITGGSYCCDTAQLRIEWVPQGKRFRVDEYDGFESLILEDNHVWQTA